MSTLAEINETLQAQGKDVSSIKQRIEQMLKNQERNRLDMLEEKRERKKVKSIAGSKGQSVKTSSSSSFLDNLLPLLRGLALPALAATAAEIAGFDDYVKGLGIVDKFKSFRNGLTSIGTVFDDLKTRLSKLTKGIGDKFDTFRLNLMTLGDKLRDFGKGLQKIKIPEIKLPRIPDIDIPKIKIPEIKLPRITIPDIDIPKIKIPEIKLPRITIPDIDIPKIKIPEIKIPKLPKIIIPDIDLPKLPTDVFDEVSKVVTKVMDVVKPFTDTVKSVLGTGTGIVADIAKAGGKGLLGLFSLVGSAFQMIKKIPFFGTAIKLLVRPFTQFLITAYDFVSGFIEGFRGTDATYIDPETGEVKVDIKKKILAGLDSGVKNVIKGILEGLDLIFVKIPGWILEKLGLPNPLEDINLTDFTDPIWSGIKNTFRFVFDFGYRAEQLKKFAEKYDIFGMVEDFFSGMFESVRNFFGFDEDAESLDRVNDVKRQQLQDEMSRTERDIAKLKEQNPNLVPKRRSSKKAERDLWQLLQHYEQQQAKLDAMPSRYMGSSRFENFGAGTPVMLHGSEAVVPERSAAGNILKSVNTQRVSDALTEFAASGRSSMSVAPVIIQDQSVRQGGNNTQVINQMTQPVSSMDMSTMMRNQGIRLGSGVYGY